MLVVCDTQSLRTTKALAPRDLSIRFPGCLVERGESLVMLRKSEAVCSLPVTKGSSATVRRVESERLARLEILPTVCLHALPTFCASSAFLEKAKKSAARQPV